VWFVHAPSIGRTPSRRPRSSRRVHNTRKMEWSGARDGASGAVPRRQRQRQLLDPDLGGWLWGTSTLASKPRRPSIFDRHGTGRFSPPPADRQGGRRERGRSRGGLTRRQAETWPKSLGRRRDSRARWLAGWLAAASCKRFFFNDDSIISQFF
jgi:hypothetical protein